MGSHDKKGRGEKPTSAKTKREGLQLTRDFVGLITHLQATTIIRNTLWGLLPTKKKSKYL